MRAAAWIAVGVVVLVGVGWIGRGESATVPLAREESARAGGVRWSYPSRWVKRPAGAMRAATYAVPAAGGDAEGGECAVFYFGSQQGGDVEGNIRRWVAQFEKPTPPARSTLRVHGLTITRVQIAGTYLAPSGPMMASTGRREHYKMLGAIVEAPEGMVFFKTTGPARTVDQSEKEFDAMLASIAKE